MEAKETYLKLKKEAEFNLKKNKSDIRFVILARVISFVITGLLIYFFINTPWLATISGIVGLGLFVYFIYKSGLLSKKKKFFEELISINEKEFKALAHDYSCFDNGIEFKDPNHFYSNDIDLFGEGSFFQCINRTQTSEGKAFLAKKLTANDLELIKEKQAAVKELSNNTVWRQHFSALAALIDKKVNSKILFHWIKGHYKIVPSRIYYSLWIFPIISLLLVGLATLSIIPSSVVLIWLFIGLGYVGFYLKKTNQLVNEISQFEDGLKEYGELMELLEKTEFKSKNLQIIQSKIKTDNQTAGKIINQLYKIINQLNNRNNFIIGIFGNGFGLWDLQYIYQFEKWIEQHVNKVNQWFEAIHEMDALIGMGTYAFNHNYTYPEISESNCIDSIALGHPLINHEKCIRNDYKISYGNFQIITGANMAGKSTFLRTVSIAIVSANNGLPVYAENFIYEPIKLISSMRSTDSLTNEESYFFSELKRLRFIIDHLKKNNYFIVLDEILKGTNSKDKEEGSKKFVRKLIQLKSSGIIATHDLSLCTLANEFDEVTTQYFDAEIKDGELHFDYQFKNGICQNMNASYLLEKMGIT